MSPNRPKSRRTQATDRRESDFGEERWNSSAEEEPLKYVLPSALPGTEFIFARNCRRRWSVFHESYVVCVCLRASAQWFYQGRFQESLYDRCFILMEPGETHVNIEVPQPQTYVVLRIAPETLTKAAVELGARPVPHFTLPLGHEPTILQSFTRLAQSVADRDDTLELQSRFARSVQLLLTQCIERPHADRTGTGRARDAIVRRCKEYVREHYNKAISLDDLAILSRMSRFHLLRSFRRAVGVPPHAYQLQLRIEQACRLLQAGVPPTLVAATVGFADQSHLSRHFRRLMFITPGAYQAAKR